MCRTVICDTYNSADGDALAVFRRALLLFADPANLPAVFHCHSGLDRTGLLSMLCLFAVGATRAEIVADYSATSTPEYSGTARSQWLAHLHLPSIQELGEEKGSNMFLSDASTMEGLLEWLSDRFGGRPEAILTSPQPRGLGLNRQQLSALRAALKSTGDDAAGAKL